jgi:hypothetical protein
MKLAKLIVVDYQEGAGGEFIANWLSAHFGQLLVTDPQASPDYLQKWLNSHSLVITNWQNDFEQHLLEFNRQCSYRGIGSIAVSYHLYRWPVHVQTLININQARFVRINCKGFEQQIYRDFCRKVLDRPLGPKDWPEIKFILQNQSAEHRDNCLTLFKQRKLNYRQLLPCNHRPENKLLPSQDIEIHYKDFFVNFEHTPAAYADLCAQLEIEPQPKLLQALIDRNKKNWMDNQSL